jgi:hypothetical protein
MERDKMSECYSCKHKEEVPGNCHIKCNKPDPEMTGNPHGLKHGWFIYPLLFDPVWKEKVCANYESRNSVNHAISGAVSQETNGQDARC